MCLRLLSVGHFEAWVGGDLLVCSSGEGGNGYLGRLAQTLLNCPVLSTVSVV